MFPMDKLSELQFELNLIFDRQQTYSSSVAPRCQLSQSGQRAHRPAFRARFCERSLHLV